MAANGFILILAEEGFLFILNSGNKKLEVLFDSKDDFYFLF